MKAAVEKLLSLLEQERRAARGARTEELLALQEAKHASLLELEALELEPEEHEALHIAMRANLWLLHHLAHCFEGLVRTLEVQSLGYTENGERISAARGRHHGVL